MSASGTTSTASRRELGDPGMVLVIGSGIAGVSAAIAARFGRAQAMLVMGGSGASALAPGAVDGLPRDGIDKAVVDIVGRLGLYFAPEGGVRLATLAGTIRPADAADQALLDLAGLDGELVLVPRTDHPTWDADYLAGAWSESAWAKRHKVRFKAVEASLLQRKEEYRMADAELAARHDDEARLAWLGVRVREAIDRGPIEAKAVILPPWLGAAEPRARTISEAVGVRCGEALVGLAGAAGRRFSSARDRALDGAGVERVEGFVTKVTLNGRPTAHLEDGEAIEADAIVLATGGLVGGGLIYQPSASEYGTEIPSAVRATFAANLDAPLTIGAGGEPIGTPGSLFGAPPEALAWPYTDSPLLERAGVLVDGGMAVRGSNGLFACGDLAADRRRRWLDALVSGALAGVTAAKYVNES